MSNVIKYPEIPETEEYRPSSCHSDNFHAVESRKYVLGMGVEKVVLGIVTSMAWKIIKVAKKRNREIGDARWRMANRDRMEVCSPPGPG